MKTGARMQAAVEVLEDILAHHRPASVALADWGRTHRFAGSGDRAAIGDLVFDALRKKLSYAAWMRSDKARALVIAAAHDCMLRDAFEAAFDGSKHAIAPLTADEAAALTTVPELPAHLGANVPEWLWPSFEATFGPHAVEEGRATASRAPLDMRVNRLKADRAKVLKALEKFGAEATPYSPVGVRIPARHDGRRLPNVEAEAAHGKGWFEVQDEGSQLAALLAGAGPRQQVLDLCAGAGGKTLAMGAEMGNTGQIYAYDSDKAQLRPIFERLKRAGVRNVQVMEAGEEAALDELAGRFDLVLVDAPCTGTGTWRRRPDTKWRLKPEALEARILEQRALLERAARMVRPGGQLTYVTCSVLNEENADQVRWFEVEHLAGSGEFRQSNVGETWRKVFGAEAPPSAIGDGATMQLTARVHGTDGFFVASFVRAS